MKQKVCGIYRIVNKSNGKFYVGSSVDVMKRWREHRRLLNNNKHHSALLQHSWNKYGENNFEFILVEKCSRTILISLEQTYLDAAKKLDKVSLNMSFVAGWGNCKGKTKVPKKISTELEMFWLNNTTIKTRKYAKEKYGYGRDIMNRLIKNIKEKHKTKKVPKNIDKTIYTFCHKNGDVFVGERYRFKQMLMDKGVEGKVIDRGMWRLFMTTKNKRHTFSGWSVYLAKHTHQ